MPKSKRRKKNTEPCDKPLALETLEQDPRIAPSNITFFQSIPTPSFATPEELHKGLHTIKTGKYLSENQFFIPAPDSQDQTLEEIRVHARSYLVRGTNAISSDKLIFTPINEKSDGNYQAIFLKEGSGFLIELTNALNNDTLQVLINKKTQTTEAAFDTKQLYTKTPVQVAYENKLKLLFSIIEASPENYCNQFFVPLEKAHPGIVDDNDRLKLSAFLNSEFKKSSYGFHVPEILKPSFATPVGNIIHFERLEDANLFYEDIKRRGHSLPQREQQTRIISSDVYQKQKPLDRKLLRIPLILLSLGRKNIINNNVEITFTDCKEILKRHPCENLTDTSNLDDLFRGFFKKMGLEKKIKSKFSGQNFTLMNLQIAEGKSIIDTLNEIYQTLRTNHLDLNQLIPENPNFEALNPAEQEIAKFIADLEEEQEKTPSPKK